MKTRLSKLYRDGKAFLEECRQEKKLYKVGLALMGLGVKIAVLCYLGGIIGSIFTGGGSTIIGISIGVIIGAPLFIVGLSLTIYDLVRGCLADSSVDKKKPENRPTRKHHSRKHKHQEYKHGPRKNRNYREEESNSDVEISSEEEAYVKSSQKDPSHKYSHREEAYDCGSQIHGLNHNERGRLNYGYDARYNSSQAQAISQRQHSHSQEPRTNSSFKRT